MASIKENKLKGKTTFYRFFAYLGRSQDGKLIRKTTTWKPPDGMTPAKERKLAELEAERWELSLTEEETETAPSPPIPEIRADDFVTFIDSVIMNFSMFALISRI